MNICIITTTFPSTENDPFGGFVYDFATELSKHHRVTIITRKRPGDYHFEKKINLVTVDWGGGNQPLSDLRFYNPRHLFYILKLFINTKKALTQVAVNEKIDHCLALWAIPSGVGSYYLLKKYNIPYDVWCLGSDIWQYRGNVLTRALLKLILASAKTSYSDGFNFNHEVEAVSGKPCSFLPSSRMLPATKSPGLFTKKTFVFIGRYHVNKGPDVLLKAIALLPSELNNNADFIFYGAGVLEDDLRQTIKELNLQNVSLNGMIEKQEIFNVIANSHFLIIPSRIDSIPVILSDSLQCYTPVIGASVGDLGDIIINNKVGYTFEKENVNALRDVITKAFYDKKENYLEHIEKANEIFSVPGAVNKFITNLHP
jgi:glycosyltransferase involved in cell wall biosynthesis